MSEPAAASADSPVLLRHKDATRQAALYGMFALVAAAPVVYGFALNIPGKTWTLALLPVVAFVVYSAIRLATLHVRLDEQGVWEPNPFRLTHVTPWSDIKRVERASTLGRIPFVGVRIVHADGESHEIVALKTQANAAYAEPTVEEWINAIELAQRRWGS